MPIVDTVKISIVCGILVQHDAISDAVASQAEMLSGFSDIDDVVILSQYHQRSIPFAQKTVRDPWALVNHPDIRSADLVIFHWGIDYVIFNAIALVQSERACVVHFHNVTPAEFVSDVDRPTIERSILQIQLPLSCGTPMWAASEFNRSTLVEWGYDASSITLMPLVVDTPASGPAAVDPCLPLRLITVGRIVPAKGIDVLVRAARAAIDAGSASFVLDIFGSRSSTTDDYCAEIEELVDELDLGHVVTLRFDMSDDELNAAYVDAHALVTASKHEGLCLPVIEAYRAGCRVVATAGGNLSAIVQPPDRVVPVGDHAALGQAIKSTLDEIMREEPVSHQGAREVVEWHSTESVSTRLRLAIR